MTLIAILAYLALGLTVAHITGQRAVHQWLWQLFIAIDQLLNVLLTPFHAGAFADETLSSRSYRAHSDGRWWGWLMTAIDTIFFWQQRHCEKAYIKERERMPSPPEAR